jgi:hypothetical protein
MLFILDNLQEKFPVQHGYKVLPFFLLYPRGNTQHPCLFFKAMLVNDICRTVMTTDTEKETACSLNEEKSWSYRTLSICECSTMFGKVNS